MHAIYSQTQNNTHTKMKSKHSEMGPVKQNPIQRTVSSVLYVCAVHCVQLLHTILHRTDLIIFPLALQTITIAPMMSIWGKGGVTRIWKDLQARRFWGAWYRRKEVESAAAVGLCCTHKAPVRCLLDFLFRKVMLKHYRWGWKTKQ